MSKKLRKRSPGAATAGTEILLKHWIHNLGLVVETDVLFQTDLLVESLRSVARAILLVGDAEGDDHDAVAQSHEGDACGRDAGPAANRIGGLLPGRGARGDAAVERCRYVRPDRVFLGLDGGDHEHVILGGKAILGRLPPLAIPDKGGETVYEWDG